jgi:hypothetical protein
MSNVTKAVEGAQSKALFEICHGVSVIQEKEELDAKIEKLVKFCETEEYKALPDKEQYFLSMQYHQMVGYSKILGFRTKLIETHFQSVK